MVHFRSRPKGNYIHEADWQQLYLLTEQWKNDLLFYQEDLKFLHNLIDTYFMYIPNREDIDRFEEIEEGIMKIDTQCADLLKRTDKHLSHLGNLIDDAFIYDSHRFRSEHEGLEDEIDRFVANFRKHRKSTFAVTEKVLKKQGTVERTK